MEYTASVHRYFGLQNISPEYFMSKILFVQTTPLKLTAMNAQHTKLIEYLKNETGFFMKFSGWSGKQFWRIRSKWIEFLNLSKCTGNYINGINSCE